MKTPKLNPIITDAFDTIIYRQGYPTFGDAAESLTCFRHFNCFLQELSICDNTWDSPLPSILTWEPEQKLTLISFLAILSDKELKELFSIIPAPIR